MEHSRYRSGHQAQEAGMSQAVNKRGAIVVATIRQFCDGRCDRIVEVDVVAEQRPPDRVYCEHCGRQPQGNS
jgi:hypothetical protein